MKNKAYDLIPPLKKEETPRREPGYYWVKRRQCNDPEIGKYNGKFWRTLSLGSMKIVDESRFEWVNDERIPQLGRNGKFFYENFERD